MSEATEKETLIMAKALAYEYESTWEELPKRHKDQYLKDAKVVLDAVREKIKTNVFLEEKEPMLGLATTHQLINELQARAQMAQFEEEGWPNYRTIDGGFSINLEGV